MSSRVSFASDDEQDPAIMHCHYLEDVKTRQAVFGKRKRSVFKKAMELSIMCGARISMHICSERGKHYIFEGQPYPDSEPPSIVIPDEYLTNFDYDALFSPLPKDEAGHVLMRRKRMKRATNLPQFYIPGTSSSASPEEDSLRRVPGLPYPDLPPHIPDSTLQQPVMKKSRSRSPPSASPRAQPKVQSKTRAPGPRQAASEARMPDQSPAQQREPQSQPHGHNQGNLLDYLSLAASYQTAAPEKPSSTITHTVSTMNSNQRPATSAPMSAGLPQHAMYMNPALTHTQPQAGFIDQMGQIRQIPMGQMLKVGPQQPYYVYSQGNNPATANVSRTMPMPQYTQVQMAGQPGPGQPSAMAGNQMLLHPYQLQQMQAQAQAQMQAQAQAQAQQLHASQVPPPPIQHQEQKPQFVEEKTVASTAE